MPPTFKLTILANNEAAGWTSWEAKIASIKAFYAPVCQLDVTLVKTALRPVFAPHEPNVYEVDPAWYQANVTPLAAGADIVMLAVPPSDHAQITLMGIETGRPLGIWQTTVFSSEGAHEYLNQADQGEAFTVYAEHELSHAFYAMLGKTDNTHLYFYGGTPQRVLEDLDFTKAISLYQQLISALRSLFNSVKTNMPKNDRLAEFCTFVKGYEGANPANNNPLNFRYFYGGYLPKYGTVRESAGGFAVFETYDLGWEYALNSVRQMVQNHPGWTFYDFFARFAPSSDNNDPQKYAQSIAAEMKVDATANVRNVLNV